MTHAFPEQPGSLSSYSFWRDVAERTVRQALQTAGPILAAVAATGSGVDLSASALALVTVVAFTVLKNVAGITVGEGSGVGALIDRAGSAAAATLLSFLPLEFAQGWGDWASVNWGAVLGATAASAVLALVNYYLAPPALAKDSVALAA